MKRLVYQSARVSSWIGGCLLSCLPISEGLAQEKDFCEEYYQLAVAEMKSNSIDTATSLAKAAFICFQSEARRSDQAKTLLVWAEIQYMQAAYSSAIERCTEALSICDEYGCAIEIENKLHCQRAKAYFELGYFREAEHDLEVALDQLQRYELLNYQDHPHTISILSRLGFLHAKHFYEFLEAETYYMQAISEFEVMGGESFMWPLSQLIEMYRVLGKDSLVTYYFEEVFLPQIAEADSYREASVYNTMGLHATDMGQYEEAYDYFARAARLNYSIDRGQEYARSLNNLGAHFLKKQQPDSAQKYLFGAENVYLTRYVDLDPFEMANTRWYIGECYWQMQDTTHALRYFKKSLGSFDHDTTLDANQSPMAKICFSLHEVYKAVGRLDSALKYFEKAIVWEERVTTDTRRSQYELQRARSDYQMAVANILEEETKRAAIFARTLQIGSALFVLILLSISISFGFRQLKTKKDFQISIVQSELRALRAQFNPHFLFNALASIQQFVLNADRVKANHFLTRFSRLMRLMLTQSDKLIISLEEEFDTLQHFLEIEQLRMPKGFQFSISISDEVPHGEVLIPSMLLQIFAENALWQGLWPKEGGGGILEIHATTELGGVMVSIRDNGIGRVAAAERKTKPEGYVVKGMQMVEDKINLFNQDRSPHMTLQVIDLYDQDGAAVGTQVEIWLPITAA